MIVGICLNIRHPGYLGLILVYIGVPFAWGPASLFIPAFLFSYPLYTGAKKEEELLRDKFGKEYEDYMKNVPWMFTENNLNIGFRQTSPNKAYLMRQVKEDRVII